MEFAVGQQVIYEYDNRNGIITGARRGDRWQVKFPDGENLFIPADKLKTFETYSMIDSFSEGRFQGVDELKRIMYRYRLSGELTNILYSMSNGATQFMPHQFIPVTKFLESYTDRMLIADEVGLGKTIESLYIWEELRARRNARRLLIVVPAILRDKWKADIKKYFGIDAHIVSAQHSDTVDSLMDHIENTLKYPDKEEFVLIISLEGIRASETIFKVLEENAEIRKLFDLTIMDEAHYMRNSGTQSFKVGELLRDVSEGFLLLSATPIQTGSENFFNLLRLLSEDEFYDMDIFQNQLLANRRVVRLTSAIDEKKDIDTVRELLDKVQYFAKDDADEYEVMSDNLEEIMGSTDKRIETVSRLRKKFFYDAYVTRTRKRDVIENRTERKVASINYPMSAVERDFYVRATEYLKSKGDRANSFSNFSLITRQRQMASCMPAALASWRSAGILDDTDEDDTVFSDVFLNNDKQYISAKMPDFPDIDINELIRHDMKFEKVREMIEQLLSENPNEKIVIFTFFRGTADYLHKQLKAHGIRTEKIMGGMKSNDKSDILERFQGQNVNVLVSTEVGSEGIDLQFAKYELNYDLPWNPMRLEQRIGRLDRIGQQSPNIYIFNAFCEETIEDRILSRLYERIEIFRDSIGDLEEILGEVIQTIELDVFLNDYQTEADIQRKADQVEQAIATNQKINRDLEMKSGMFSAYHSYILDNIQKAHDSFRKITPGELMYTVKDFLNNRYPGSTVEATKYQDTAKIRLSDPARDDLVAYLRQTEGHINTSLAGNRVGTLCTFSNRNLDKEQYREIVDINHPLTKWILNVIRDENVFSSGCAAVSVSKKNLRDAAEIMPGIYVFYIQKWIADGASRLNELHYFMADIDGQTQLNEGVAESLISTASLYGNSFDTNYLSDEQFDDIADTANRIMDNGWEQYDRFEIMHRERNRELIRDQKDYITRTTAGKIMKYESTIENLRYRGTRESVINMWRGKIRHAEEDREDRIRRLNAKFDCPITCGEVAIGILSVTE